MKLSIDSIINLHKGKTAWVIANGPSTRDALPHILSITRNPEQRKENVFFVCNEIDKMLTNINLSIELISPEYWVNANSQTRIDNYYQSFNQLSKWNGKLVYSNSVDLTIQPEKYLSVDYLPYDQRHFKNQPCPTYSGCCKFCKADINSGRLTVQEELQKYSNHDSHYGTGSTVALHMLAFAVLSGCNKINVTGIDLNYKLGYFDQKTFNPDNFSPWLQDILADFQIIRDSANKIHNLQIQNLSRISPLQSIFNTGLPL